MVRSFRHKGLRELYVGRSHRGVRPEHAERLRRILIRLAVAAAPGDMDFPGLRLHRLSGEYAGSYAVSVSGNWRVVFRFEVQDVVDVDYVDYH